MEEKDYKIDDSGKRQKFDTGARRDTRTGKGRFDLLPPRVIKAIAIHFEKGAVKYGDRNWEKGIPVARFIDSAMRHAFQFLQGVDDGENHLISTIWNFACAYETILRIQEGELPEELYNLPKKIRLPMVTPKKPKKSQ